MRNIFRLSKSLTDDTYIHLISLNPIAVFVLPECTCLSGDKDPKLQKKALTWFQKNEESHIQIKRFIPPGYEEAIQIVRDNIELIDIAQLAIDTKCRELDLVRVLDGVKFKDKPYHFSYRIRKKFLDEVQKLLL